MANPWITFLQKYYADRKKKQPGYKYSDAMKDAKVEYNKKGKKMKGGGSDIGGAATIAESSQGSLLGGNDSNAGAGEGAGEGSGSGAGAPPAQKGGRKSRRRKGTKSKKSRKGKRKSRSSRK